MHKRFCLKISVIVLLAYACICIAACSKKVDTARADAATNPEIAELTKQIRRYALEKRKLPQSMEELVTAGYIQAVPKAPAGKKYAIDADRAQAILLDQ